MLTLLPQLLFLTPVAIAILRISLGFAIAYTAWGIAENRGRIMQTKFFMIGHMPEWLMWTRVIGLGIISMLLIVGAWTQAVAIVSSFAMLKYGIAGRSHPGLLPLPTSTYYLLAIIAFALVGTGSGAFALDLPL